MSRNLRVLVASAAALGAALGACSSPSPSSSGSGSTGSGASSPEPRPAAVVQLKFVSFEPARLTVRAGQTVEWVWGDAPVSHNVTFGSFSSPTQANGKYFHTFDQPGTYSYRCTIHQTMTGEVVVLP